MKILDIKGREILDSRGNPTVEVDVVLEGGARGRAAVPSGASTGEREALELRDGDSKRFLGKGVAKAVVHINNGLYAHIATLAANTSGYLLPVPMMNILNGGAHADSNVDFQEFMVMPLGFPSFSEGLRAGTEVFHALRSILKGRKLSTGVGDEGGFAPSLKSNREALDYVMEAIGKAGARAGENVFIALDVAASEFWAGNGRYEFHKSGESARDSQGMVDLYVDWCKHYPIISIEDGCAEQDWDGWK